MEQVALDQAQDLVVLEERLDLGIPEGHVGVGHGVAMIPRRLLHPAGPAADRAGLPGDRREAGDVARDHDHDRYRGTSDEHRFPGHDRLLEAYDERLSLWLHQRVKNL